MQPEGWTGPFQVPRWPQKEAGPGLGQADPSSQAPPYGRPVSPGSGARGHTSGNQGSREQRGLQCGHMLGLPGPRQGDGCPGGGRTERRGAHRVAGAPGDQSTEATASETGPREAEGVQERKWSIFQGSGATTGPRGSAGTLESPGLSFRPCWAPSTCWGGQRR